MSVLRPLTLIHSFHTQMVEMTSMPVNVPIKTEFMETFNSIINPPPPPLMPVVPVKAPEDGDTEDTFASLPPLEDCFLPEDLIEGGLMENLDADWDFGAALDFIFDKEGTAVPASTGGGTGGYGSNAHSGSREDGQGGGHAHTSGTGHEWFNTKANADEAGSLGGGLDDDSPMKFFYEDALQRLRFEEFVKSFLGMSVFHTAECWVAAGTETLEQVRKDDGTATSSPSHSLNSFA